MQRSLNSSCNQNLGICTLLRPVARLLSRNRTSHHRRRQAAHGQVPALEITTKPPPIPFSIAAYLKAYPGRLSPSLPRRSSLRPHPISWLNGNEASPLQSITGAGLDLHWPQSRIRHSFVVTIFRISMGYFIVYIYSACDYTRRIYMNSQCISGYHVFCLS